jgi:ribose transport system substrate-binding protein
MNGFSPRSDVACLRACPDTYLPLNPLAYLLPLTACGRPHPRWPDGRKNGMTEVIWLYAPMGELMIPAVRCDLHVVGRKLMNKLNVVVSLITDDNDYQLEQAASAQAAAAQLGIDVQIIYSGNDAVQQTQQILRFIQDPAKRPDAILAEPVGTGMAQIAKAAVGAGIAWGIINTDVDYITQLRQHALVPVFSVMSDHEAIGKIQGQQIGALIGEQGCVLYLEGPSVRDVAKVRTRGMLSTKPQRIDIKTLKGDWTQNSGYQAIKSWLTLSTSRQLHISMIACQNDDMAIGARRAFEELADLKERDAWLRLPITGCDGVPRSGQEWVRQGRLTATVVSPPLLGDAMQMLASAVKAGSQPAERTLVSPSSFPALKELQKKARGQAQT